MLNVGVIGCGVLGKDHIKRLSEKLRGVRVAARAARQKKEGTQHGRTVCPV